MDTGLSRNYSIFETLPLSCFGEATIPIYYKINEAYQRYIDLRLSFYAIMKKNFDNEHYAARD